jgi:hypothetical protein
LASGHFSAGRPGGTVVVLRAAAVVLVVAGPFVVVVVTTGTFDAEPSPRRTSAVPPALVSVDGTEVGASKPSPAPWSWWWSWCWS